MFTDKFLISIHGRQIGLQRVTTAISGGTRGQFDFLTGTYKGERMDCTTADTTAINLLPFGNHILPVSSVGSSQVFTIDPPIPGVAEVNIMGSTVDACYLKTANSEVIVTTAGSSWTTVKLSSAGGGFSLIPMTTGIWMAQGINSGTSSQAGGFTLTTST